LNRIFANTKRPESQNNCARHQAELEDKKKTNRKVASQREGKQRNTQERRVVDESWGGGRRKTQANKEPLKCPKLAATLAKTGSDAAPKEARSQRSGRSNKEPIRTTKTVPSESALKWKKHEKDRTSCDVEGGGGSLWSNEPDRCEKIKLPQKERPFDIPEEQGRPRGKKKEDGQKREATSWIKGRVTCNLAKMRRRWGGTAEKTEEKEKTGRKSRDLTKDGEEKKQAQ